MTTQAPHGMPYEDWWWQYGRHEGAPYQPPPTGARTPIGVSFTPARAMWADMPGPEGPDGENVGAIAHSYFQAAVPQLAPMGEGTRVSYVYNWQHSRAHDSAADARADALFWRNAPDIKAAGYYEWVFGQGWVWHGV